MRRKSFIFFIISSVLFVQSCKISDLRTPVLNPDLPNREEKAIELLDRVIETYHLERLKDAETYSLHATDNWKGLFALVNPFPKDNKLMEIRFRPASFDGQFNYVDTKKKTIYGVQSFQHYQIKEDGIVQFKRKKSISFSLPAVQYFFELPFRLRDAPILKYAGTQIFENKTYDLVFATWDRLEPHKEHDQYLLYIDSDSGHLRFANYTVRGMYLPAPRSIFGSIRYDGLTKNENGIIYPSKLIIQLNKLKKAKRNLHVITLDNLRLNSFELSQLYPDKTIKFQGDSKP